MHLISRQFRTGRQAHRLRANALACGLAAGRFIDALDRLRDLVAKANFNPAQPRAAGGGPGGGQWIYVEGYAQGREPEPAIHLANSPGIGDNRGPPLDPPEIPEEPPVGRPAQLQTAKTVAKWLALNAAFVFTGVELGHWLYRELPSIRSYGDAPKTMDELIGNAEASRPGYERHHIVEQPPARNEQFPDSMIDGVNNVVSVPTYKHREISGWYQQGNPLFGGLSPREYLRGKDWSERVRIGEYALRKFEVLKP